MPLAPPQAAEGVDWQMVAALRAKASDQLSQAVAADRGRLDKTGQQELGRAIVLELIDTAMVDRVNAGSAVDVRG